MKSLSNIYGRVRTSRNDLVQSEVAGGQRPLLRSRVWCEIAQRIRPMCGSYTGPPGVDAIAVKLEHDAAKWRILHLDYKYQM